MTPEDVKNLEKELREKKKHWWVWNRHVSPHMAYCNLCDQKIIGGEPENTPCPGEPPEKQPVLELKWCNACKGFYVECPRCGNNTCNGGYGEDGKCPVCPSAYDLMHGIEKAGLSKIVNKLMGKEE